MTAGANQKVAVVNPDGSWVASGGSGGTVSQGTPTGNIANAWPVKVTDGTHTLPLTTLYGVASVPVIDTAPSGADVINGSGSTDAAVLATLTVGTVSKVQIQLSAVGGTGLTGPGHASVVATGPGAVPTGTVCEVVVLPDNSAGCVVDAYIEAVNGGTAELQLNIDANVDAVAVVNGRIIGPT